MKEQISEDFFKELYNKTFYTDYSFSLKEAKQKGYIKQSREEEIREKIKKIENVNWHSKDKEKLYRELYELHTDLLQILDNKEKDK